MVREAITINRAYLLPVQMRTAQREVQKMEAQCRKAYVSVNLDVDKEGAVLPRFIRWDNGQVFNIDQTCINAAPHQKGWRRWYSLYCHDSRKESYLFHEGDKWFVEAKEGC